MDKAKETLWEKYLHRVKNSKNKVTVMQMAAVLKSYNVSGFSFQFLNELLNDWCNILKELKKEKYRNLISSYKCISTEVDNKICKNATTIK